MSAQDRVHLQIVIVGAGLGGIAAAISCASAGHSVEVIEQASELGDVGAGLQITPNASRLLKHWGIHDGLWESAVEPTALTVRRYTGQVLAHDENYAKTMRSKYGTPFIDMHRADLHRGLVSKAEDLGVSFHLGMRVDSIDFQTVTVRTSAGHTFAGDLIIAADGLWSLCREKMLGKKDEPFATGDLAYRIILNAEDIPDPEVKAWIENPTLHFWIGPHSHAVGYSIRGSRMYNLVLLVPDNLPAGVSRQAGSVDEMRALFTNWDPILNKFLSYIKSSNIDRWKLMHHAEMENWVNDASSMVLIGDACHPMLPYLAQGANSSLEDGAVLGMLLGKLKNKSKLPQVLRLYERLRKSRGEAIVRETFEQRKDFHMPDGPGQVKRDSIFLSQLGKEPSGAFPNRFTCPEVQPWIFGYDAVDEVEKAVAENCSLFQ